LCSASVHRPAETRKLTAILAADVVAESDCAVEVGACVPPAPKKLMDPRQNRPVVLHSADVFADKNGIVYCTDWSGAGLHIMEYTG
jgi:hypothetical protein